MPWHKKYRQINEQHRMSWFDIKEEHMMEAYIARHKDEKVLDLLEDAKTIWCTVAQIQDFTSELDKKSIVSQKRHLEDTKKILNPCTHLLKTTSKTIVKFLMQSYFNCWLADT